jgi:hypothetical protein
MDTQRDSVAHALMVERHAQWQLPDLRDNDRHIDYLAKGHMSFTIPMSIYSRSAKTFGDVDTTCGDDRSLHLYNFFMFWFGILDQSISVTRADKKNTDPAYFEMCMRKKARLQEQPAPAGAGAVVPRRKLTRLERLLRNDDQEDFEREVNELGDDIGAGYLSPAENNRPAVRQRGGARRGFVDEADDDDEEPSNAARAAEQEGFDEFEDPDHIETEIIRSPFTILLEEVYKRRPGDPKESPSERVGSKFLEYEQTKNIDEDPIAYTIHVLWDQPWDPNIFMSKILRDNNTMQMFSKQRLYSNGLPRFVQIIEPPANEAVEDNNEVMRDANNGEGRGPARAAAPVKRSLQIFQPNNSTQGARGTFTQFELPSDQKKRKQLVMKNAVERVTPMYLIDLAGIYYKNPDLMSTAYNEEEFTTDFDETSQFNANKLFSLTSSVNSRDVNETCYEQSTYNLFDSFYNYDPKTSLYMNAKKVDQLGFFRFHIPASMRNRFVQVHIDRARASEFTIMPFPHVQRRRSHPLETMYPTIFDTKQKISISELISGRTQSSLLIDKIPMLQPLPPIMIGNRSFSYALLNRLVDVQLAETRASNARVSRRSRRSSSSSSTSDDDGIVIYDDDDDNGEGESYQCIRDTSRGSVNPVFTEEAWMRDDQAYYFTQEELNTAKDRLATYKKAIEARQRWRMKALRLTMEEQSDSAKLFGTSLAEDIDAIETSNTSQMNSRRRRIIQSVHAPIDRMLFIDDIEEMANDALEFTRVGERNGIRLARLCSVMKNNPERDPSKDPHVRAAYMHYQKGGIAEDTMISDSSANIPIPARVTYQYGELKKFSKSFARPLIKVIDPSMDVVSNVMAYFQFQYSVTLDMASENPGILLFIWLASLNSTEHKFAPHLHTGLAGDTTTSKSYILRMCQRLRISIGNDSTSLEASRETTQARSTGSKGLLNYYWRFTEEMNDMLLSGNPKEGQTTGNPIHKTAIDAQKIITIACFLDKRGNAMPMQRYSECIGVESWASNNTAAIGAMHLSIYYRYMIVFMLAPKNHGASLGHFIEKEAQRGSKDADIKTKLIDMHHCIQYIVSRIDFFIAQRVMADVNTWLATMLIMRVMDYIWKKYHIAAMAPRTVDHVRRMARTLCLVDAASQFFVRGGRYAGNEELGIDPSCITAEKIVALEPSLFVRVEHVVAAFGLCIQHCFFPGQEVVKSAIHAWFLQKKDTQGVGSCFEQYNSGQSALGNPPSYYHDNINDAQQEVPDTIRQQAPMYSSIHITRDKSMDWNWVTFKGPMGTFLNTIQAKIESDKSINYIYPTDLINPIIRRLTTTNIEAEMYEAPEVLTRDALPRLVPGKAFSTPIAKISHDCVSINYHWLTGTKSLSPTEAVEEALKNLLNARHQPFMRCAWVADPLHPSCRRVLELGNKDFENPNLPRMKMSNACFSNSRQLELLYDSYDEHDIRWRTYSEFEIDVPLSEWAAVMHYSECNFGPKITERTLVKTLYKFEELFKVQDPQSYHEGNPRSDAEFETLNNTDDLDAPDSEFLVRSAHHSGKGAFVPQSCNFQLKDQPQEVIDDFHASFKRNMFLAHVSQFRYAAYGKGHDYPKGLHNSVSDEIRTDDHTGISSISEQFGISSRSRAFSRCLSSNNALDPKDIIEKERIASSSMDVEPERVTRSRPISRSITPVIPVSPFHVEKHCADANLNAISSACDISKTTGFSVNSRGMINAFDSVLL